MDTQTAGYQNKLLGAVAQTDYTDGLACLWGRLKPMSQQNPFLSLKIQASSKIIWFEMFIEQITELLDGYHFAPFAFMKSSHHFVCFFSSGRLSLHKTVWHEAEYVL